jgi:hypothetical protein
LGDQFIPIHYQLANLSNLNSFDIRPEALALYGFGFWILKVLPLGNFSNSEDSPVWGFPVDGTVRNVVRKNKVVLLVKILFKR